MKKVARRNGGSGYLRDLSLVQAIIRAVSAVTAVPVTVRIRSGWDDASRTCIFDRGVRLGYETQPRTFNEGDPMPLVFGQLADDDMCNMFGYFIKQSDLAKLP